MRRLLNTIYVTTEDAWLRKDGANVVVEADGVERGRVPLHLLEGIVCFGRPGASPALMAACAEAGIALTFLTPQGRFLARVEGPRTGNVLLRRTQYRVADDPARAVPIVRGIVAAKAANQRSVVHRALRDHGTAMAGPTRMAVEAAMQRLARISAIAAAGDEVDVLRGFEGVGFDPQVGVLHADRPGRASLALDLMEELRPVLADRLALTLVNRGQVRAADFRVDEGGAVSLTDEGRKKVLVAWQERKKRELRHPFMGEAMPMGLVAHAQALLLSRHMRGDLDGYPPFVWK